MFFKIGVLDPLNINGFGVSKVKNIAKFTGKHLRQSLLTNKVVSLQLY